MAVGGDVERFVVVEQAEDGAADGRVDDGGRDDLVHRLVILRMGGIVDDAGAAAGHGAGEEGHPQGFVVGYALEGADQIRPFQVLQKLVSGRWSNRRGERKGNERGGQTFDSCVH